MCILYTGAPLERRRFIIKNVLLIEMSIYNNLIYRIFKHNIYLHNNNIYTDTIKADSRHAPGGAWPRVTLRTTVWRRSYNNNM